MSKYALSSFFTIVTVLVSGCISGVPYRTGQVQKVASPPESMAQIVFLRDSSTYSGGKVPAVLVDVSGEELQLISAIPNRTKVVYLTDPGKHYFMVYSIEAADFLQADLLPGKTYYVLVRPFTGAITYRFSFAPIRKSANEEFSQQSGQFKKWLASTTLVEADNDTVLWEKHHLSDVVAKRKKFWQEWMVKLEYKRLSQTLNGDDGVSMPINN